MPERQRKLPPCGNPECGVSTGIHDGLTFGCGDLDMNGFWQIPCQTCARAWEQAHPEDGKCWPFENRPPTRAEMLTAEHFMLEDALEHLDKCMVLLKSLVGTMRDRKAGENGSEPYRKEFAARFDERFIEGEVAGAIACVRSELEKVKVPEK
jgi:hypothetical protein